jgi:hypothetical protein
MTEMRLMLLFLWSPKHEYRIPVQPPLLRSHKPLRGLLMLPSLYRLHLVNARTLRVNHYAVLLSCADKGLVHSIPSSRLHPQS